MLALFACPKWIHSGSVFVMVQAKRFAGVPQCAASSVRDAREAGILLVWYVSRDNLNSTQPSPLVTTMGTFPDMRFAHDVRGLWNCYRCRFLTFPDPQPIAEGWSSLWFGQKLAWKSGEASTNCISLKLLAELTEEACVMMLLVLHHVITRVPMFNAFLQETWSPMLSFACWRMI